MTLIRYALSDEAWSGYNTFLENILSHENAKKICEVGGGANPSLSIETVKDKGLEYTILDISEDELAKAPSSYNKVQANICSKDFAHEDCYDFVFSKMLAEHVMNGKLFNTNILNILKPGGKAFHFFPTLFAPPFLLNFMLPESLSRKILDIVQSGRDNTGKKGKFPAYYQWCRGPTHRQIKKYENLGYIVEEYIGFFGHSGYYHKVPTIQNIHNKLCHMLLRFPQPVFTSFAYVILKKPDP